MPKIHLQNIFSGGNWKEKISNVAQVGGIETSVVDNGQGRNTRMAWINTGSGLRYKVVPDRGMDIADSFFNNYSLSWISHSGSVSSQSFSGRGLDWLRTFGGGLLTTCGLSHVGGPESDEYGERGLHGMISNLPAEIESVIQPDPFTDKMEMSITGRVRESQALGPSLELKRTIASVLGKSFINIHDEVINRGNEPAPHMLLYHCNLGWPLVDEGSDLLLEGAMTLVNEERDRGIFNAKNNFRKCLAPMKQHNGRGEAAASFDAVSDRDGFCHTGVLNEKINLALLISFKKTQLPLVTNWQHWGFNEYVAGLEPGTHPPIGQAAARKNKSLIFIAPGESMTYNLRMEVINDTDTVKHFFQNKIDSLT